jgi:hypothetical protein
MTSLFQENFRDYSLFKYFAQKNKIWKPIRVINMHAEDMEITKLTGQNSEQKDVIREGDET